MGRVITLTTDFGFQDSYVGVMKGVILSIAASVTLVDGTHDIPPQDIRSGSFHLACLWPYFPRDTIHIVVVDPGVGTARKAVAVQTPRGIFVGPDNGVLAPALCAQGALDEHTGRVLDALAVSLTNEQFHLPAVSNTFHGRDIFAPAAAHLSNGVPLRDLGPPVQRLELGSAPALVANSGMLLGSVQHVDRFGNLITNVPASRVPARAVIRVGNVVIAGLSSSYQQSDIVALIGSSGYLEIGVRNGDAASVLGITRDASVTLQADA